MRTPESETDKIDVAYLYNDTIGVKPQYRDWSEGYAETWEYYEAYSCQECGAVLCCQGENRHCDLDDESDCQGYLNCEGPMMNYSYALPQFDGDTEDAAKAIADLPLCVVSCEDQDGYALALTGGGMDLSWQICEAYMRLGYLPPVHLCRLPRMAGMRLSKKNAKIIEACRRSVECALAQATRMLKDLDHLEVNMSSSTEERED